MCLREKLDMEAVWKARDPFFSGDEGGGFLKRA
jgi:hypothetical protein